MCCVINRRQFLMLSLHRLSFTLLHAYASAQSLMPSFPKAMKARVPNIFPKALVQFSSFYSKVKRKAANMKCPPNSVRGLWFYFHISLFLLWFLTIKTASLNCFLPCRSLRAAAPTPGGGCRHRLNWTLHNHILISQTWHHFAQRDTEQETERASKEGWQQQW